MDKLTICKVCQGNACYEQVLEDGNKTYMCFGCGMSSSTLMKEGSDLVKKTLETSPELYKDLSRVDKEGLVWFPATISLPEKGIVFADGTNNEDWSWKAAKVVRILEEERERFPDGQEFKIDMKNAKTFGKKDFMDALGHIDFYSL